jgi:hypothetical protein
MATDVEIERALNALAVTLNDQRLDRVDVARLDAIVVSSLGGEPHLRAVADELQPEELAWVQDDGGETVGRIELEGDGRWSVARTAGAVITQVPPPLLAPGTAPGAGFRDDEMGDSEVPPSVPILALLGAGALAAPVLVGSLMLISEVAGGATWATGVYSSTWTPLRGVAALVFGTSAYGGDFDVLPIAAGVGLLGAYATLVGAAGAALIGTACGPRPNAAWAIALGIAWALLVMQALAVNVVVSFLQSAPTVYESMPSWGWWIAHAAYGAALGLATAVVARRTAA